MKRTRFINPELQVEKKNVPVVVRRRRRTQEGKSDFVKLSDDDDFSRISEPIEDTRVVIKETRCKLAEALYFECEFVKFFICKEGLRILSDSFRRANIDIPYFRHEAEDEFRCRIRYFDVLNSALCSCFPQYVIEQTQEYFIPKMMSGLKVSWSVGEPFFLIDKGPASIPNTKIFETWNNR